MHKDFLVKTMSVTVCESNCSFKAPRIVEFYSFAFQGFLFYVQVVFFSTISIIFCWLWEWFFFDEHPGTLITLLNYIINIFCAVFYFVIALLRIIKKIWNLCIKKNYMELLVMMVQYFIVGSFSNVFMTNIC